MVKRGTLNIWLFGSVALAGVGILVIMTQPVGELGTPLAMFGIVLEFSSMVLLVAPIVTLTKARSRREAGRMPYFGITVDEYMRPCYRCGTKFMPRRPYHRFCDSCYREKLISQTWSPELDFHSKLLELLSHAPFDSFYVSIR